MGRRPIVLRGVTVGRVIAASDMTARLAQSKVDPTCSDLQTILAAIGARGNSSNLAQVFTTLHIAFCVILYLARLHFQRRRQRHEPIIRVTPCPVLTLFE